MKRKQGGPRSPSSKMSQPPNGGTRRNAPEKDEARSLVGQEWATALAEFCSQHVDWWSHWGSGGPVYHLPKEIIDELSPKEGNRKRTVLSAEEAAAERAFLVLCQRAGHNAVGVWGDRQVRYPLFDSVPNPPLSEEFIHAAKWDIPLGCIEAEATDAIGKMDADRHQQLGYVGALTFDENYQNERKQLIESARTFAASLIWPLVASSCEQKSIALRQSALAVSPKPAEVAKFFGELRMFLRKRRLAAIITWDLPLPQGPLASASTDQARHLLGPDQVVTVIPSYYDIPSSSDLRAEAREQQRRAAHLDGIRPEHPLTDIAARTDASAGIDHPSTKEMAFRMWFQERTVRNRYGAPRGMAARLESALASLFDVGRERVRQVRKLYVPFLDR
jgi:hypothetical protein